MPSDLPQKKHQSSLFQLSTLLFVVSSLLLLFIPIWIFVFLPQLIKLPDDFNYLAKVKSTDNFYDSVSQTYTGEVQSITNFRFSTTSKQDDILTVENFFDVRKPNGEQIISLSRNYGIDAVTGKHVAGRGDKDRTGYLFAPKNLSKQDFEYWHINYDQPVTMKYQQEEELFGLKTYHYQTSFTADQTDALKNLPDVGITKGVSVDVKLELWIEPVTGWLVKYEDHSIAYYYDLSTKARLSPWNAFHNQYQESSILDQVERAHIERQKSEFLTFFIPLFILTTALLLLAIGVLTKWNKFRFLRSALPLLVLIANLIATYFFWSFVKNTLQAQSQASFESEVREINDSIEDHLETYSSLLRAGQGLFASSQSVERAEWKAFVQGLNLAQNYPGVQGLGFIKLVPAEQKEGFIAQARAEGVADYKIWPEASQSAYAPIYYLEPMNEKNVKALGFDISSDTPRKEAMFQSRDSAGPAITAKLNLVQDDEDPTKVGFLMIIPVYSNDSVTGSVVERRAAATGFVYSPFRMEDFMRSITDQYVSSFAIQIYDTEDTSNLSEETLMYSTGTPGFIQKVLPVHFGEHFWTVVYSEKSTASSFFQSYLPTIVLASALTLSIFLSLFVWVLVSAAMRAERMAQRITEDLRDSEEKYRSIFNSLSDVLYRTDMNGVITTVSPSIEKYLGIKPEQVIGKNAMEFYPNPQEREEMLKHLQQTGEVSDYLITLNGRDQHPIAVSLTAHLLFDEQKVPVGVEGLLRDVSNRKKTEDELKARTVELERMNQMMIDRELKMVELKKELEALKNR